MDLWNLKPVEFASIVLVQASLASISDTLGQYTIDKIFPGTYTIRVTCVGFNKVEKNVSVKNILLAAVTITFIHWIVSDMGVWLASSRYPKTPAGFWACLTAAIPFERNFLLGTLVYSAIMFGSFEWMKAKYPSLRIANA